MKLEWINCYYCYYYFYYYYYYYCCCCCCCYCSLSSDHPFQVYYKVRQAVITNCDWTNSQMSGYHPRPGHQTVFSHANFSFLRFEPGGVGHGPRDQFCPITSLQMADWFFHLCAGSLFDFLRFSPFIKWFTMIFFGKVWVDRCSKPQFLKQYDVCLFSIDIVRCNSSCA